MRRTTAQSCARRPAAAQQQVAAAAAGAAELHDLLHTQQQHHQRTKGLLGGALHGWRALAQPAATPAALRQLSRFQQPFYRQSGPNRPTMRRALKATPPCGLTPVLHRYRFRNFAFSRKKLHLLATPMKFKGRHADPRHCRVRSHGKRATQLASGLAGHPQHPAPFPYNERLQCSHYHRQLPN